MSRIASLAWKEVIQLKRDRVSMAMIVMLPLIQLLLFGFAIDTDVRHVRTIVYDQDRSHASRRFVLHLQATTYSDAIGNVASYREVDDAFQRGDADAALVIPPKFSEHIRAGQKAPVQVIVNGTDPQIVGSVLSATEGLAQSVNQRLEVYRTNARGQRPSIGSVQVEPLIKYNPDRRSAVFIVPGLIGVILTMTMTMFTAMAIARERERGTLEALIVSPARPVEIIVGKILPYVVVGYVQMAMILMVGRWVFDVPIRGSLGLLFALAGAFIVGNLAVGLLFSTVARTQQQAMQMSIFFLLPNILLSGFMFPFSAMPSAVQWLAQALPLTHFVRIVRRILLQDASFPDVAGELHWMLGIVAGLILITLARFKKKLL